MMLSGSHRTLLRCMRSRIVPHARGTASSRKAQAPVSATVAATQDAGVLTKDEADNAHDGREPLPAAVLDFA